MPAGLTLYATLETKKKKEEFVQAVQRLMLGSAENGIISTGVCVCVCVCVYMCVCVYRCVRVKEREML